MDEPVEDVLVAASGLEGDAPDDAFSLHLRRRLEDFVWRYVSRRFPATARILQLGSGGGELSENLVRSGFAVTVADADPDRLALCRRRLESLRGWRAIRADCLNLPCDDGEFDLVLCLDLIARCSQPERALREMRRVLKPGGVLLFSARNAWAQRCWDLDQLAWQPLLLGRKAVLALKVLLSEAGQGPAQQSHRSDLDVALRQGPRQVMRSLPGHGYRLADFAGLGYGPLVKGERALCSETVSIQVSDRLEWISHATGLIWLTRWLARDNLFVAQRRL